MVIAGRTALSSRRYTASRGAGTRSHITHLDWASACRVPSPKSPDPKNRTRRRGASPPRARTPSSTLCSSWRDAPTEASGLEGTEGADGGGGAGGDAADVHNGEAARRRPPLQDATWGARPRCQLATRPHAAPTHRYICCMGSKTLSRGAQFTRRPRDERVPAQLRKSRWAVGASGGPGRTCPCQNQPFLLHGRRHPFPTSSCPTHGPCRGPWGDRRWRRGRW
jgi:hypothetical protein